MADFFVMQGNFHQADTAVFGFKTAGNQCVPNSIVAAVLACHKHPSIWQQKDLDFVLRHGDMLYTSLKKDHNKLLVTDIPKKFTVDGRSYTFDTHDIHVGLLPVLQLDDSPFVTIEHALTKFVASYYSQNALLCIGDSACSLMSDGNELYLFDPHSRNTWGQVDPLGKSVLLHFRNVSRCAVYLKSIVSPNKKVQFEMTQICITEEGHDIEMPITSNDTGEREKERQNNFTKENIAPTQRILDFDIPVQNGVQKNHTQVYSQNTHSRNTNVYVSKRRENVTCICCHRVVCYGNAVKYKNEKYDWSKSAVITSLNDKLRHDGSKHICRSCHKYLTGSKPKVPLYSPSKFLCEITQFELNKLYLKCSICEYMSKRIADKLQKLQKSPRVTCLCCHRIVMLSTNALHFNKQNYDFNNANVKLALSDIYTCKDTDFICVLCHKQLRTSNTSGPKVPSHSPLKHGTSKQLSSSTSPLVNARKQRTDDNGSYIICEELTTNRDSHIQVPLSTPMTDNSRALNVAMKAFHAAVQELPEFVCVCCHCMLFRKGVIKYKKDNYDIHNNIVRTALSDESLYQKSDNICHTCHRNLKGTKQCIPKMPAQAVANGLKLDDIPVELKNINTLERRFISYRIPFMQMVHKPKGGQYGLNGPCINVPARLDAVCDLLPRLPHEVHIIPFKLKYRLVYKGHHMYNKICPETVLHALKWLKQNNIHYKDVRINENWIENSKNDELWEIIIPRKETGNQYDITLF